MEASTYKKAKEAFGAMGGRFEGIEVAKFTERCGAVRESPLTDGTDFVTKSGVVNS